MKVTNPSGPAVAKDLPPLVSVVIPTFNRARLLPDAVRSVLEQSHENLELIVVDDGSTDDTTDVLAGFDDGRLQCIRIERSGSPSRARNVGLARAKGRYVAFLDSDDVWLPIKLERQLAALRSNPGYRWSYTLFDHIDEAGVPMAPLQGGVGNPRSGWILESMVTQDALVMVQSVVAESSLVREVGGFDETPLLREDLEMCFRLASASAACAIDDHLLRIRHHRLRTTYGLAEVREWRVRALDKLERSLADPRLRRLCRRECAMEMVDLARVKSGAGRPAPALRALGAAVLYRPWHPSIWTTLPRVLAKALATERMLRVYRRVRDGYGRGHAHRPR